MKRDTSTKAYPREQARIGRDGLESSRAPAGRVSRWAALFVALLLVAGVSVAQNLISGASANPQSGSARLDYLTVGAIDAGTLLFGSSGASKVQWGTGTNTWQIEATPGSGVLRFGNNATTYLGLNYVSGYAQSSYGFEGPLFRANDGTAVAPPYSFTSDTDTGLYRVGANQMGVTTAGTRSFNFTATPGRLEGTASSPRLQLDGIEGACLNYGDTALVCAATNVIMISGPSLNMGSVNSVISFQATPVFANTTPTISSGFGTSPSVTAGKATAFRVNVGTGGTASSGVIAIGATATNGWNCMCTDLTTSSTTVFACKQTASSTTTATIGNFSAVTGVAAAWAASDILAVNCVGF